MTELTRHEPTLTPQGLILKPEPHRSVVTNNQEEHWAWIVAGEIDQSTEQGLHTLEHLSRYLQSINDFLAEHDLPPYRLAELPLNHEIGMTLISPKDMMAVQVLDETGVMRTYHCPRSMPENLSQRGLEHAREIPYVEAINDRLRIVHFPMTSGPPKPGEEPQELLMSIIMEKTSASKNGPVGMIGNLHEMTQLAARSPAFEPIRLSKEQFELVTQQYETLNTQFEGQTPPLSPNLIAEKSNVIGISAISVSGKFHRTLNFTMTSGEIRSRLVNRGEKIPEKNTLQEAACFMITAPINGEKHIAVTRIKRLSGQAAGYEETALSIPRGFSLKALDKPQFRHQLHVAETESGLSGQMLAAHQVNTDEKLSSDPTLEDVEADYFEFDLPQDIDFELQAKLDEEPTKAVEELVPSWLSLRDAIKALKTGEVFTEAFSIALLTTWLFRREILTLKTTLSVNEDTNNLGIAMEKVQDWRTGGDKLTIWRSDSSLFSTAPGPLNPNDGINKRHYAVGIATHETTIAALTNTTKPWQVISLSEFVDGIKTLRWDNVTIAAGLKLLFQLDLLDEHPEKLQS